MQKSKQILYKHTKCNLTLAFMVETRMLWCVWMWRKEYMLSSIKNIRTFEHNKILRKLVTVNDERELSSKILLSEWIISAVFFVSINITKCQSLRGNLKNRDRIDSEIISVKNLVNLCHKIRKISSFDSLKFRIL